MGAAGPGKGTWSGGQIATPDGRGAHSPEYQHPFRVAIEKRRSHAGNAFYDYAQNAVPFPDGLATWLRLEGGVIPFGNIRPSKKGYPTREGTANLVIGGTLYVVTAFLTESKDPYWVKVVAHKVPDRSANIRKAQAAPRGGRILL